MSKIWWYDHIEDNHTLYHGKDCIKKFFASLRGHTENITDFENKKMLSLTKEELKSHQDAKVCYSCEKKYWKSSLKV